MEAVTTPVAQGSEVRKDVKRTPITLDRIYVAEYQKEGTLTAQISQTITTKSYYPSKRTTSDLQGGLFGAEEFGFSEQEFESIEKRVAWIAVPLDVDQVEVIRRLQIANQNGAVIYKILSNAPVLDNNQAYSLQQGQRSMDHFANSQAVRFPDGHEKAKLLTLDKNYNVQYRRTFFSPTPKTDEDRRNTIDIYLSAEIAAELQGASVIAGQTI